MIILFYLFILCTHNHINSCLSILLIHTILPKIHTLCAKTAFSCSKLACMLCYLPNWSQDSEVYVTDINWGWGWGFKYRKQNTSWWQLSGWQINTKIFLEEKDESEAIRDPPPNGNVAAGNVRKPSQKQDIYSSSVAVNTTHGPEVTVPYSELLSIFRSGKHCINFTKINTMATTVRPLPKDTHTRWVNCWPCYNTGTHRDSNAHRGIHVLLVSVEALLDSLTRRTQQ